MLRRTLLGAATLGLVSLPYVMSTSSTTGPTSGDYSALDTADAPLLSGVPRQSDVPLTGRPVADLAEIFRFDITPKWVFDHWPRVETTTNQPELKGYRVPVVTGSRLPDLAGSLTYYFNARQEPQRIVFHGTTGDAEPLARLMTSKFNFRRVSEPDAGTLRFQVQWSGKPVSELRVRPAQVVDANEPYRRFDVNLLIERPMQRRRSTDGERKLSDLRL